MLFEEWKAEEISSLNTDNARKTQLVSVLADTARVINFFGIITYTEHQLIVIILFSDI